MPRRDEVTRREVVAAIEREATAPVMTEVRSHIALHVPSSTSGRCPCCGSDAAKLDDIWPDLRLFIHRGQKRRFLRRQFPDPGKYDAIAERAELTIDNLLRCTEKTLPVVLDEERPTILVSGSGRSMKTHTGTTWSARQWMLRGGFGVLACFLGFELQQAHILKDKLIVGEGDVPPVLDPRLALYIPPHERSLFQYIRLLDDTRIRLTHTKGDGGNLAGKGWAWAQWTEAAKTTDIGNFGQARGRIVSTRGQLYIDAVPESSHWLQDAIVDPAEDEAAEMRDAVAKGEAPPKPEYRSLILSASDNPWNTPESTAAFLRALEKVDPRLAARYAKGMWKGDANKAFADYFDRALHCYDHETFRPGDLGLLDVTERASQRHFGRPHPWIVAVDVNANPHSALIGKICVKRDLYEDIIAQGEPENWIAVFFDVLRVWDMDSDQAARELLEYRGGMFKDAGVIIDGTSCYAEHNAGGSKNARRGFVPRQCYENAGFEVMPPDEYPDTGNPKNPDRFDSTIVGRRMLRERRVQMERLRCHKLATALRDQDSEGDGITPKRSPNTWKDRHVVSMTDVYRYWLWPFFSVEMAPGTIEVH